MIPLRLAEVAQATGGRLVGDPDIPVASLTTDSRAVGAGALFVALEGPVHDGHDHVGEAIAAGAVAYLGERAVAEIPAVLVDDSWRAVADLATAVRRRVDPTVIAVTGSVGKTTTKDLTAAAAGAGRRTVAARGSYNNELGVPLTCLAVNHDTEVLVVEVGARGPGHIAALMPLVQPDVAIVTAIAAAHLQMFRDLDTVAASKGELVDALSPAGTALLNADDPRVVALAERTDAAVLTYGRRPQVKLRGVVQPVDLLAADVTQDRLARPRFRACTPWGTADVALPLAGEHHVAGAVAALGAAVLVGVDVAAAAAALARAPVSAWRSEVREAGGVVVLNDAYNANPASVEAALRTLAQIRPAQPRSGHPRERAGRTWAVLGVMAELGAASVAEHERIGRYCVRLNVDRLVVVGEEAWPIAKGADLEGFFGQDRWHVPDAAAALELLRRRVTPGDVVLVKASRVAGLEAVAAGLLHTFAEAAENGSA